MIQTFWSERINIAKVTGSFLVIGVLIALFSPLEYSTSATLIPETGRSQGPTGGLLQQYGGLLGISGDAAIGTDGTIPPQLYPNIVESLPYQIELMNTKVHFSEYDTTATVHTFFTDIYSSFSLLGFAKEYTIGLPGKIFNLFRVSDTNNQNSLSGEVYRDSLITVSKEQLQTVKTLRERISVSVEQETGLLTISTEFPDPRAAAEVTQAGIAILKESVKAYRTEKARQNLEFVQQQVEQAKKRFEKAQQQLAEFRDSNLNLATAKAQSREQELQSHYDLTFNLYNSLSQRLEQAKLDLQENTPVLSVLQPVSVPLYKSEPKRLLILTVSVILGFISALVWVLILDWWRNLGSKKNLNNNRI